MELSNSLDVLSQQRALMLVTALWPRHEKSVFYRARSILSWFLCATLTLALFIEIFYVLDDFSRLSDVLSLFISPFGYILKKITFVYYEKKFFETLAKLEDPIFQKYPSTLDKYMQRSIRLSRIISISYQSCCAIVITLYSCKPFVTENYELPFTMTWIELGYFKYLAHFWQSFSLLVIASNNSALDIVAVGFMMIAASHFDILYYKLRDARSFAASRNPSDDGETLDEISSKMDANVNALIAECVQYHIAILKFLNLVQDSFSFGFLAQFMTSIVVICNTGFALAHGNPSSIQFLTMFVYFTAMMVQLALYCWFGNEVLLKSYKLGDACYMSEWTNCGTSVRKSLLIIMERSKRPVVLTAMKFAGLSLISFTAVIRSSYSYFALMQRMYAKHQIGEDL